TRRRVHNRRRMQSIETRDLRDQGAASRIARDRVRVQDEVGQPPEVIKPMREVRALLTKCAESMPTDAAGQLLLERATDWYKEEVIGIWMSCRSTAQILAMAKPPIEEDPRRILEGAVDVMQRLKIRPRRNQAIRQFGSLYESFRESAPRGPRSEQ